jgi:hypothetical protein
VAGLPLREAAAAVTGKARIEVYSNGRWVYVGTLSVPLAPAWRGALNKTLPAVAIRVK